MYSTQTGNAGVFGNLQRRPSRCLQHLDNFFHGLLPYLSAGDIFLGRHSQPLSRQASVGCMVMLWGHRRPGTCSWLWCVFSFHLGAGDRCDVSVQYQWGYLPSWKQGCKESWKEEGATEAITVIKILLFSTGHFPHHIRPPQEGGSSDPHLAVGNCYNLRNIKDSRQKIWD